MDWQDGLQTHSAVTIYTMLNIDGDADGKGLFTPSDPIADPITLMGKMGMQPILPIIVLVKKIKGVARQRYVSRSV